jgi:hypothetical protein
VPPNKVETVRMRRILITAIALCGVIATPLAAQEAAIAGPGERGYIPTALPDHDTLDKDVLLLVVNRRAVVTLGDKNAMTLTEEKDAGAATFNAPAPGTNKESAEVLLGANTGPVAPSKLAFSMWRYPLGGTSIMLENGLDKPVTYLAAVSMVVGGQRRIKLTTICTAGAGNRSVEQWPLAFDAIQVIQVIDAPAGSCLDPTAMALYRNGDVPPSSRPTAPTSPTAPVPAP